MISKLLIMSTKQLRDDEPKQGETKESSPSWLELVGDQVNSLKFGTVQITVHDSRVTQVERLEKVRLDRPK
jgi:hypothetical protein